MKAKRSEEGCLKKIGKNFLVDWMDEWIEERKEKAKINSQVPAEASD